jgi:hypothetical protein
MGGTHSVSLMHVDDEAGFLCIMSDFLSQCAQMQGDWIVGLIDRMKKAGERKVVAEREYEDGWGQTIREAASKTLVPGTKSVSFSPSQHLPLLAPTAADIAAYSINIIQWYMGDNIPGKLREPLLYLGGVPNYYAALNEVAAAGYQGFHFE